MGSTPGPSTLTSTPSTPAPPVDDDGDDDKAAAAATAARESPVVSPHTHLSAHASSVPAQTPDELEPQSTADDQ